MAMEMTEIACERDREKRTFAEIMAMTGRNAPQRTLSVDPGDTTGYAVFEGTELVRAGQMIGNPANLEKLIEASQPTNIVCEEYRIYGWMTSEHAWSDVPTLRLIGALEMLCQQRGLPLAKQSAKDAKGFCTDQKLKSWGLYQTKHRHANDAIRHACFNLLFGRERR